MSGFLSNIFDWNILQWAITAIAYTGTLLNSARKKIGFYFWIVSNTCFCIRNYIVGEYAQSVFFFLCLLTAINGIRLWTKQEREEKAATEAEATSEQ